MSPSRLSFISRITLVVFCIEVAAFAALGWFYVDKFSSAAEKQLYERFELVADMLGNDDLPVSAISRKSYMGSLLDAPYLKGKVIGGNGRVIVSTEPSQLGYAAASLPDVDPLWLEPGRAVRQFSLSGDRLTGILQIHGPASEVPLYTAIITVSMIDIQSQKGAIILSGLVGSVLFILLSSIGIIFITYRFYESEHEVAEAKKQLEQVLWSSGDGWWDWDVVTGKAYFDERWTGMLGYAQSEVAPSYQGWEALIHPDDLADVRQRLQHYLNGELPDYQVSFRMRCQDGEWKWILARGKAVERDKQGKPTRMTGTHSDITEDVKTKNELAKAARFGHIVENSLNEIYIFDSQSFTFSLANHGARSNLGYTMEELTGLTPIDLMPEFSPESFSELIQPLRDGKSDILVFETVYQRKDGSRYDVAVHLQLMQDEKNPVFVAINQDITERKRLQGLMVQTEKMMSVGGLAAGMAHELNNPLGGVLQGVQNVRRRLSPELEKNSAVARELGLDLPTVWKYFERRGIDHFLDGINEAGERAALIVRNMLQFARKSDSALKPEQLDLLIDRALELAAVDYNLKKEYDFRKVEVIREYDASLPHVNCIASEIQQVLLNLVRNAAQALFDMEGQGAPRITVRTYRQRNMACIEVEDNGPGMDEATRIRVFDPFFTTREVGEGTGLGLSVSYFIITHEHNGQLSVSSQPGRGARFTIKLPIEG